MRRRLYSVALIDEIGPLFAIYTLWFSDNGITVSQVSTVFLLWAAVSIVLEIPSGAVADRVDRRWLLGFAFALRALGIAVWLIQPTFAGVVIGALLWATHSTLASGAWEALIYDQLDEVGEAGSYGPVMARVEQSTDIGIVGGTGLAIGLLQLGASLEQLGWVTVAIHSASIAVVLSLPAVALPPASDDGVFGSFRAWWFTLRAGVADIWRDRGIAKLVVLAAIVEGLFIFDEYVPLIARDRGAADGLVPVLVLAVWAGRLIGSELAARRPATGGATVGPFLAAGVVLMSAALISQPVWALAAIGFGYIPLQMMWVISGARLQERLAAGTRATVTSARGFLGGIINTAAFAVIALSANGADPRPGLYLALVALGALGLVAPNLLGRPLQNRAA